MGEHLRARRQQRAGEEDELGALLARQAVRFNALEHLAGGVQVAARGEVAGGAKKTGGGRVAVL